jgi:putative transposase
VIQEAYIQGISTRSVDELVKAMLSGISHSKVGRLYENDQRIKTSLDRPLEATGPR